MRTNIIKTERNSAYLYAEQKQILYLNPILESIIQRNGDNKVDLGNHSINKYSNEEIEIQKRKYNFLAEHFSDSSKLETRSCSRSLKEIDIEYQLANLRQLTFEVTDACNLKCEYCGYGKFYEDYDSRESKFLNIEAAKKLIDFLSELWNSPMNTSHEKTLYISFYGGEPLLNMTFIKLLVDYIDNKALDNLKVKYSMTTNSLLLKKNAEYLVKKNFRLLLSLDGDKRNTSYRVYANGKNSYDDIIENVNYLKKTYPDYFDTNVSFNSVLHDRNSVEDIHSYFKKRYNKLPSIGELNNMGIKDSMKEVFNKTYNNFFASLYDSTHYEDIEKDMFIRIPTINSFGIFTNRYTNNFYKSFLDFYIDNSLIEQMPTGSCLPFSKKMFVTVNGKILACEKIGHQFSLGNIDNEGVNLDYSSIAERYNLYFSKLRSQCEKCYMQDSCTQCIFNIPGIDDKTVRCEGFTNLEGFKEYLSSEMSLFERKPEYYHRIMREVTVE